MGTILQWRKFHFFDIKTVIDSDIFTEFIANYQITCSSSGRGVIYIGDSEGNVHSLDRQLQISSFNADNSAIKKIYACDSTNLLITIKDNFEGLSTLKVWSLDRFSSQNAPSCVRTIHLDPRVYQNDSAQHEMPVITAISFCSTISLLAVGFSNGAIILYKDVQKERGCNANLLPANISSAITNLHIRYTHKKVTYLFVTTNQNIYCINILARSKDRVIKTKAVVRIANPVELDDCGCNAGCSTLSDSKHDHELLVAREDAIYAYTTDSRTSCYVFEGVKLSVSWFRGYLVVVAKEEIGSKFRHVLTIYDPLNKLVTLSTTIDNFVSIVSEWGGLYVVTSTPSVLHLSEIDLQSKLDLLFKKNQFDIAISIAKTQYRDQEEVCEILKQYGDWLYGKGNSAAAMEQYIKTIPYLEPSYVIKKFLDTQHIENLTIYLKALHKEGHASSDHTTLMLNCYTRLRDSKQLDNFILDKEIDCDVDVAVKVCRGAGYLGHALSLCLKHKLHPLYLSILINDKKDYEGAIGHLANLPMPTIKECILDYGTTLLKHKPDQLIDVIVGLCTNYDESGKFDIEVLEDFEHLLIGQSEAAISLLEKVLKVRPLSQQLNTFYLSELLYQYSLAPEGQDQSIIGDKILKILRNNDIKYDRDHTLLLCDKHNFVSGKLVIWEQTGMCEDLIQWHADNDDYESVVEVCQHHGETNQELWSSALRLITRETNGVPPDMDLLKQILKKIEEYELLPPLTVADCITRSPHVTLGQVKHYIQNLISSQTSSLQNEVSQFAKQQHSVMSTKHSISSLSSDTIYFTNTKCNICNNNLELPSTHFLCRHSYHKHCLESYSENDDCPLCAPDKKILHENSSKKKEAKMNEYSALQEQLEGAPDCFSVLAQSISNGALTHSIPASLRHQYNWKPEVIRKPVVPKPVENIFFDAPKFPAYAPKASWKSTEQRPITSGSSLNKHITPSSSYGSSTVAPTVTKDVSSCVATKLPEVASKSENPFEKDSNPFGSDFEDEKIPSNPFEEEEYDNHRNPFASKDSPKQTAKSENPFDDYDPALNPFDD